MRMKRVDDTGSIEDGLPPDGYGQWNIEPPDTYASWGEYLAHVSHLAIWSREHETTLNRVRRDLDRRG